MDSTPSHQLDLCVLDTLANDIESLADILRLLNHPDIGWREIQDGRPFSLEQLEPVLRRCIRDGLVEVLGYDKVSTALSKVRASTAPNEPLGAFYFQLTADGRRVHREWSSSDA